VSRLLAIGQIWLTTWVFRYMTRMIYLYQNILM
jgi:hypothetical protein